MIDDPDFLIFKLMYKLAGMVDYHSKLYYVEDSPVLTDAEFDMLFSKLEDLEISSPHLVLYDSPTQRVGGAAAKEFSKVKHLAPCLSLKKASDWDEFRRWDATMRKELGYERF